MVEPEIIQHFFELAVAVHRAIHLRHRQLGHNSRRSVNLLVGHHRAFVRIAAVVALLAKLSRLVAVRIRHVFQLLHHRILRALPSLGRLRTRAVGCAALHGLILVTAAHHRLLGGAILRLLLLAIFLDADSFFFRRHRGPRKFLDQLGVAHLQRRKILQARLHRGIINRIGIELRINPFREPNLPECSTSPGRGPYANRFSACKIASVSFSTVIGNPFSTLLCAAAAGTPVDAPARKEFSLAPAFAPKNGAAKINAAASTNPPFVHTQDAPGGVVLSARIRFGEFRAFASLAPCGVFVACGVLA